jgi:hypothetical protein
MSASEESTNGHSSFPFEESFDLEQYISHYTSETRLQRLAFIAQQTTDATLQQTANRMLEHDVKQAGNLVRYKQLHPQEDDHWIQTTTANNEASLQVLEARLSAAQANLNKDAIRTAFLNLADFSLKTGQVRDALKYTLRARDYCTSRQQTGLICWNVIELALNLSNYNQVRDYVTKAEHAVSSSGDADFPRKLKVAAALALLGEGHYKEAALKLQLVKVPPQAHGSSSFCSPEDVALYSALLGLATMDRTHLSYYLEQQAAMLELVPALKEAIRHYIRAEYKPCLQIITSLPLQFDMYLARHADKLVQLVRNRAHVDYLQPYQKVHLSHMARTFGEDPALLQTSLAQLIGNGDIPCARINCQTNTLERHVQAAEASRLYKTQARVQRLQEVVLNDAYASIVRLAVLEHEPVDQLQRGNHNPEDVLADVDSDSEDDDDVDMAYDNIANPDDAI